MTSGTDVIDHLRTEIEKLDEDLRQNAEAIEICDRQITSLAAQEMVHWPDVLKTQLRENEKGLPSEIKSILAQRELVVSGARTSAHNDGVKIARLAADLEYQVEQRDTIAAELEGAESSATSKLQTDPRSERIRNDIIVRGKDVSEMELKIASAGLFLRELLASLDSNAILRHLDARSFGTEQYQNGFLTRIEERMARATGYYTILGHIASTKTLLQVLHDALRERQGWRDAALKVAERHTQGHFQDVEPIRRRLAEQTERADTVQQDIERLASKRDEALETIARISEEDASGAIPALIKIFDKMSLDDVEKLARQSKGDADDVAVASIRAARDEIAGYRNQLRSLRDKRTVLRQRRETLDGAVSKVRRNSWHSDRSRFDGTKTDLLVRDLITGMATLDAFENGLRSARRAPPPPVDTSWTRSSSTSFESRDSSSSTFSTGGEISSSDSFKTGGGF